MAPLRTAGFALMLLMTAPAGARETIGVIGDAGDLPALLRSSERRVIGPADMRTRLEAQAASAGPGLDELRALAEQGRRSLYSIGDFAAAATALSRAANGWLESDGVAKPLPDIARVVLDLAVALDAAGSSRDAERELALALRLDPDLAVDPAVHGPPVRRALERARSASPRAYSWTITSSPDGASINLDGRPQGTSPVVAELAAGSHWLEVLLPGHEPLSTRIEVSAGSDTTLSVELQEASPSRRALEALEAGPGGIGRAAGLCREALDLDAVIAVIRSPEEITAIRTGRGGTTRTVHGETLAAVRTALYPRLDVEGPSSREPGSGTMGRRPAAERAGGSTWWIWVGAGVVVAGVVTTAIVLATSGPDERAITRVP